MKIGFLMGSFDPIHIGHINMVREALNFVDKVVLVVSGHNPWKEHNPAPFDLRVEMCNRVIQPFGDAVEVSDIEGTFEPPYYSNKPLKYFREKYKDDVLFIICGEDTVDKIPNWKDAETDILPFYNIIEIPRYNKDRFNYEPYKIKETKVFPLLGVTFDVSSTNIRSLIKEKKQTYPLLPIEVYKVIMENNLYT